MESSSIPFKISTSLVMNYLFFSGGLLRGMEGFFRYLILMYLTVDEESWDDWNIFSAVSNKL